VLVASPTVRAEGDEVLEVQALIDRVEAKEGQDTELALRLAEFERDLRARGVGPAGLKSPEYYQGLDTPALARECFFGESFSLGFKSCLQGHSEVAFGLKELEVLHPGFAELFTREDMWRGLALAECQLAKNIVGAADARTVIRNSQAQGVMGRFFGLPSLRAHVVGHEEFMLAASVEALEGYNTFLQEGVGERLGRSQPLFYGEVWEVGRKTEPYVKTLAPGVQKRIDRQLVSAAVRRQADGDQRVQHIQEYLNIMLPELRALVSEATRQALRDLVDNVSENNRGKDTEE